MTATTAGNHFDKVRYDHVRGNDARVWEQVIVTICFVLERLDVMAQPSNASTHLEILQDVRASQPASKR